MNQLTLLQNATALHSSSSSAASSMASLLFLSPFLHSRNPRNLPLQRNPNPKNLQKHSIAISAAKSDQGPDPKPGFPGLPGIIPNPLDPIFSQQKPDPEEKPLVSGFSRKNPNYNPKPEPGGAKKPPPPRNPSSATSFSRKDQSRKTPTPPDQGETLKPDTRKVPDPQPDPPADKETGAITDESGTAPGDTPPEEDEEEEPAAAPSPPEPQVDEDGSGGGGGADSLLPENGSAVLPDSRVGDLKRMLVGMVSGTDYGFTVSADVRGEIFELVSLLEAKNPTLAPTEEPEKLDGNWILQYTAFSELLPLVAVGTIPLVKVKQISQAIDTKSMTVVNAATISNPFASFSFSATASFEVVSSSRVQVRFKEGDFPPPEIFSAVDLPAEVEIFGRKISLVPVQQTLNPLQEAFASITRSISGLSPLKVPFPGSSAQSWLLTTYLDEDFRISRGDGGLFVLVKEGSPLLDNSS
ncbi:putative plastid-lipid-associated protein 3, chloroplastic [Iris pallida]|uniref:Plastid-lipid-associated protein 3, chloroplastic n=1 Tax=Iris pallida TaxID=29817 RepID=A0AAX6H6L1_IRIPA|nr:putative plastid-lipid-associated protein 3, chloroplastic [Iris pallida]